MVGGQALSNVPEVLDTATVKDYSNKPTMTNFKCVKTVTEGRTGPQRQELWKKKRMVPETQISKWKIMVSDYDI